MRTEEMKNPLIHLFVRQLFSENLKFRIKNKVAETDHSHHRVNSWQNHQSGQNSLTKVTGAWLINTYLICSPWCHPAFQVPPPSRIWGPLREFIFAGSPYGFMRGQMRARQAIERWRKTAGGSGGSHEHFWICGSLKKPLIPFDLTLFQKPPLGFIQAKTHKIQNFLSLPILFYNRYRHTIYFQNSIIILFPMGGYCPPPPCLI